MFGLFSKQKTIKNNVRCVSDATRVYAIGDVHGCLGALDQLLEKIRSDIGAFADDVRLVFLGDLIDRGPASAEVIERVVRGPLPGSNVQVLMGNHEEAMLAAYDGSSDVRGWLSYGGMQTLESYGISRAEHFAQGFDLTKRLREVVPPDHIAFLRSLPDHLRIGHYLFVHAGIRPGVPLEQQRPEDLRWIRSGFLDNDTDHGMTVVHGHTIAETPQIRANRIGIDTGCYAGGPLTALVLEGCEQRFLQVQ